MGIECLERISKFGDWFQVFSSGLECQTIVKKVALIFLVLTSEPHEVHASCHHVRQTTNLEW